MKAFLLFLASSMAAPGFAACTGDLPGRDTLEVFNAPTGNGVVGGIAPRQCGLEVTDFCQNGRCLSFYAGLSGYIDVTGLQSGTIMPPPLDFTYRVTGADGTVEFMGRAQALEFGPGTVLRAEPAADHIRLFLPEPFKRPIHMTSTGSSGWEAVLPDWKGVPVPVMVYLDRLSAPSARLELQADDPVLKMNLLLHLKREGGPDHSAAHTQDDCASTEDMAQRLYSTGQRDLIAAFFTAVERAGIDDWSMRSPGQCRELLRQLDAMDIRAELHER